jgi:filamentous hemagglutinin
VGEITGEALADELLAKYDAGEMSFQDLIAWQGRGVNISRLLAGFAAAVAGGDVDAGAEAGGNAAENNAFGYIIARPYVAYVGVGDTVKGLARIGNGEDSLSQGLDEAITTGISKGVQLAYNLNPEATKQALEMLIKLDGATVSSLLAVFPASVTQAVVGARPNPSGGRFAVRP